MDKKETIKEAINKSRELLDLYNSSAFQNHFKEYLEAMSKVQWLDPKAYKTQEDFMVDYQYQRARASVSAEILQFLGNQQAIMNNYIKTLKHYDTTTTN